MKELKVILATPHPKMKNACDVAIEVYLKSEVDPVIAELNGQVNGFKNRANLWEYNAQNEHNGAVTVRMENAKLKAKLAEKDKKIAELKEQYKDMDVTHTVHIAKMNARIEELEQKLQDQCISCPVKMQEDDVVAEKDNEIRRLKRALYKACANWAHHRVFVRLYTNEKAWENVESKCLKKAEQYK